RRWTESGESLERASAFYSLRKDKNTRVTANTTPRRPADNAGSGMAPGKARCWLACKIRARRADKNLRRRAQAAEGRISKLQGHEEVEGRKRVGLSRVPRGGSAARGGAVVRSPDFPGVGHPLSAGGGGCFPLSPLRGQELLVVIPERGRRRDGSEGPNFIGLGQE